MKQQIDCSMSCFFFLHKTSNEIISAVTLKSKYDTTSCNRPDRNKFKCNVQQQQQQDKFCSLYDYEILIGLLNIISIRHFNNKIYYY